MPIKKCSFELKLDVNHPDPKKRVVLDYVSAMAGVKVNEETGVVTFTDGQIESDDRGNITALMNGQGKRTAWKPGSWPVISFRELTTE